MSIVSILLGIGGAVLGYKIHKAVESGSMHSVNAPYGLMSLIGSGLGASTALGWFIYGVVVLGVEVLKVSF